jgi:hypothetical protein
VRQAVVVEAVTVVPKMALTAVRVAVVLRVVALLVPLVQVFQGKVLLGAPLLLTLQVAAVVVLLLSELTL